MRQFTIPSRSPEGSRGGYASRPRDAVADANSTIAMLVEASRRLAPASPASAQEEDDHYDDGLVHNHGWARTSSH